MAGRRSSAGRFGNRFVHKNQLGTGVNLSLTEAVRETIVRPGGEEVVICIVESNAYDDDYRLMYTVGFVNGRTQSPLLGQLSSGRMMSVVEAFRQFVVLRAMLQRTERRVNDQLLYDSWFAALLDTDPDNTTARQHGDRLSQQLQLDLWGAVGSIRPAHADSNPRALEPPAARLGREWWWHV